MVNIGTLVLALSMLVTTFAYFMLQKTTVTLLLDTFILEEPHNVFEFLKSHRNWPKIHFKMQSIDLYDVTEHNDTIQQHLTVRQKMPHIGHVTYPASISSTNSSLKVKWQASMLHGLIEEHVMFSLQSPSDRQPNGPNGCVVYADSEVKVSALLRSFIEREFGNIHSRLIDNLKIALEVS